MAVLNPKDHKVLVDNAVIAVRKAKYDTITGEEILALHDVIVWLSNLSAELAAEATTASEIQVAPEVGNA